MAQQTNNERVVKRRLALILSGILLVIIVPIVILLLAILLDLVFHFPIIIIFPYNIICALPILVIGFFWAIWANFDLYRKGKGSPVPTKSTETIILVESGPYKYCRNPMIFGYVLIFVGLGFLVNSLSLLIIFAPLVLILLVLYVKLIEERDLEARFGESYVKFKQRKSFILPWPSQKEGE